VCDPRDEFVYEPLDLRQKSIRVLVVLPTSTKTAIRCEIRQVLLGGNHVCLSYTWGEDADHKYIELNGKPFRVRPNLYEFLVRARRDFMGDELWVDAVCIDQRNVREKSAQVQIMPEIYRSAREVLIWAGSVGSRLRWVAAGYEVLSRSTWLPGSLWSGVRKAYCFRGI